MHEIAPAAGAIQETYDRVKRAYGSAIGRHRRDVVTPALLLDLPAARRNITKMADRIKKMPAGLRPHI
jgi:D-serine deaminase-like pyridoxal phosphate-dependent protein